MEINFKSLHDFLCMPEDENIEVELGKQKFLHLVLNNELILLKPQVISDAQS